MNGRWGWVMTRDLSQLEWDHAQADLEQLLEGLSDMVLPPFPFSVDDKPGFLKRMHGGLTRRLHTPPFEKRPGSETHMELWCGPNARKPGEDPAWHAAIFPKLAGEYSIDAAGGLHELALMGWLAVLHRRDPEVVRLTPPVANKERWEEATRWAGQLLEQKLAAPVAL